MDKKNGRTKVRLIQMGSFTALFFLLCCLLLNYLSLLVTYPFGNDEAQAGYWRFRFVYLVTGALGISRFLCAMIALILALFCVIKLDTLYMIKHGNENIKGAARFMETKEIEKELYSFPENNIKAAEKSGIPLYRENGRIYIDAETIHSLIIGTTRSGKGQTFVMPMIRFICNSQAKHSMVINDPKGEMLENCYDMLIENGYDVVVLNLRDTQMSSLWNPLQIIIDEYKLRRDAQKNGGDGDLSRCIKLCQSLANVFTHNEKSDPIWPESAKSLFVAMLLYMLEQGYDNGHLENVSLYSLYQMFIEFGTKDETRKQEKINALDELFQSLPIGNPAKSAYATSNFASGEMRSSIFSTLASNLTLFGSDVGVSKLTSGNQIDFKSLSNPDKPMALFMLVPDNETSRYVLASLFVNQCYDELVELSATFTGQKLKQRVHFILDEFGNMVHIPNMDTKITVGAGRNLLFDLFVQDLNQLDSVYGNEAKTIRSNCGNLIYINSLDRDTNEYFSSVLGNKTIEYNTYSGNLNEWLTNRSGSVDSQPLLTADELSNLPKGSAVTKRQRCRPMQTQFDFFYKLGIKPNSLGEIASKMTLINRELSETIYPIDEMWANIIERTSKGDGRIENQNYKWKEEAQRLLKEKENGNPKWVWQIDSSRTDDPESEIFYRLVRRSNTVKTIRTNFAPKVEIVSDVENILKLILDKNPKDFKTISDMTDQLAEMNVDDKQASVKKLKLIIRKQMYLSAEDKKKLEQYVGTFCNC